MKTNYYLISAKNGDELTERLSADTLDEAIDIARTKWSMLSRRDRISYTEYAVVVPGYDIDDPDYESDNAWLSDPVEYHDIINQTWYAIENDEDDNDWGTGSYDYDEAVKMLRATAEYHPDARIAVIKIDQYDSICDRIITLADIAEE